MVKIADDDKVYELLDKWHDEDEYDKILEKIFEIPREQWSNKLWFRVISAYNNKEMFKEAAAELEKLKPQCELPGDLAKWYYMFAYMFYANNREVLALWYLKEGLRHHPGHEGSIRLKGECEEFIATQTKEVKRLVAMAAECIERRQKEVADSQELRECKGAEFAALLSFPTCIRVVPGIPKCMGLEAFYKCESEEAKKETREYLQKYFGITDKETTMKSWSRQRNESDFCDFKSFWNNEPRFDISKLTEDGKSAFESAKLFCEIFREYVEDTGIGAADINTMMTTIRIAYACDILTNTDYSSAMQALEELARKHYHSWKEYAIAAFCGGAYEVYCNSHMDLRQTINYMKQILSVLPHMDWFYYQWEKAE